VSATLPSGPIACTLPGISRTGSENVSTTSGGRVVAIVPAAGFVRSSAACADAGPAGASSATNSPSSSPASTA
jgi:hypothetical protein